MMNNKTCFFLFLFCILTPFMTSCSAAKKSDSAFALETDYSSKKSAQGLVSPLKPLIVLDSGHGGTDEGAKVSSLLEKKITLTTALLTKKHLEEMGYKVILTRSRDTYLSLPRRVVIANKNKASLFVSIHFNASKSKEAKGIEIFYCNSSKELWRSLASRRLANCILFQLLNQTEAPSRGVKNGNFHVIRETQMPAVLVEGGFVTNQQERDQLKDRKYLNLIAEGIADGIDKYFKS